MLLLMRRVGEAIRIKEDIIIEIKKIQDDQVILAVEGLVAEANNDEDSLKSPEEI